MTTPDETLRERLIAAQLATVRSIDSDDWYPVHRVRTNEQAADAVLAVLAEQQGDEREAREMLGDNARREDVEATTLSLIFQKHYLDPDSARRSPDNLSECVCGEWSEGEMEPGWDDHLAEVAIAAGFRRAPVVEWVTSEAEQWRKVAEVILEPVKVNGVPALEMIERMMQHSRTLRPEQGDDR